MSEGPLLSRVAAWLVDQDWLVEPADQPGQLVLHPSDGLDPWPVVVVVQEEHSRVLVYSVLPDDVPEAARPAMTELLTRVNDGLLAGVLEMDLSDGAVRARTGLDLGAAQPDDATFGALMGQVVGANLTLMDAVWGALHDVAAGRTTSAKAAEAAFG
jgi:hypothetical protein